MNNYQMPNGNSYIPPIKQLPIGQVDELADSLAAEYHNPDFRRWYCGVIYQFGVPKVEEWRGRAREAREPAKIFSKYVADARHTRFRQPGGVNE